MKYIIDIPEDRVVNGKLSLFAEVESPLSTRIQTGIKCEPYTEPVNEIIESNEINLCDSCKLDYPDCWVKHNDIIFGGGVDDDNICCCKKYDPDIFLNRKVIEDEVWETIRKIFTDGTLSGDEDTDPVPFYDCFGEYYFHEVLRKMSYQEAKAKYEAWSKQNIREGDEVIYDSRTKAVVLKPETKENYGTILTSGFATISVSHDDLEKTGRHFEDVAELLKKMKEN